MIDCIFKNKIVILLLITVSSALLFGLNPDKKIHHYVHEVRQTDDGLPQNTIFSMIQSQDGYIWMGTMDGLVRYDGIEFRVFNRSNVEALRSNYIRTVFEAHDGTIWVGTNDGGITAINGNRSTTYTRENGLKDNSVRTVAESQDGEIWIGTREGISRINKGKVKNIPLPAEDKINVVSSLIFDREGVLRIGTVGGGIFLLRDGKIEKFKSENLSTKNISSLHISRKGTMWVGTRDRGLYRCDGKKCNSLPTTNGCDIKSVWTVQEDSDDNLWIGTWGEGLFRYRQGKCEHFSEKEGLSNDMVISILEDREKNLWTGTWTGGVNIFKNSRVTTYTTMDGLSGNSISAVFGDRKGILWVGTTAKGLNRFEDGKFKSLSMKETGGINQVRILNSDTNGNLLIGSWTRGILSRKEEETIPFAPGYHDFTKKVSSLFIDENGDTWLSTYDQGVKILTDSGFKSITAKEGLTGNLASFVYKTRNGDYWIGSWYNGLFRYRNGKVKHFGKEEGLHESSIWCMHEDSDGYLWIGTYSGGIILYRNQTFTSIRSKDGLFDDLVYTIVEDDDGYFWMSGNKGIGRVARSELLEFTEGKKSRVSMMNLGLSDGLKTRECNGGFSPSAWKHDNGKLYFPTVRGLVEIDPKNLPQNTIPPDLSIDKVIVDGRRINLEKNIELAPETTKLEFHYRGISFSDPVKVQYRYILEGLDREWSEAGTRRTAYYMNIPPGHYRFKVIAKNNDGVWNRKGATFRFYKKPFFYQTIYFKIGLPFFIILSVMGLFSLRLRQLKNRERELKALVEQRTKELREASLSDALTGLRNRRFCQEMILPEINLFTERKEYEKKHSEKRCSLENSTIFGLLLLDIDHFKKINDELGHDAGDAILRQFSEILKKTLRKDDFVVRWGGEEFLIVLKNTTPEKIEKIAGKIKKAVSDTEFRFGETTLKKTCSIGHVPYPFLKDEPGRLSFDQTVKIADMGLYYSKENGRNLSVGIRETGKSPDAGETLNSLEKCLEQKIFKLSASR